VTAQLLQSSGKPHRAPAAIKLWRQRRELFRLAAPRGEPFENGSLRADLRRGRRWHREIGCEIPPHRRRDTREIGFRHAHDTEAESGTPMRLAADKRKIVEQRLDRCFLRGKVIDGKAERSLAVWEIRLKYFPVANAAYRGKRLHRLAEWMLDARRVERESITRAHPFEWACLAVVYLREGARHAV